MWPYHGIRIKSNGRDLNAMVCNGIITCHAMLWHSTQMAMAWHHMPWPFDSNGHDMSCCHAIHRMAMACVAMPWPFDTCHVLPCHGHSTHAMAWHHMPCPFDSIRMLWHLDQMVMTWHHRMAMACDVAMSFIEWPWHVLPCHGHLTPAMASHAMAI